MPLAKREGLSQSLYRHRAPSAGFREPPVKRPRYTRSLLFGCVLTFLSPHRPSRTCNCPAINWPLSEAEDGGGGRGEARGAVPPHHEPREHHEGVLRPRGEGEQGGEGAAPGMRHGVYLLLYAGSHEDRGGPEPQGREGGGRDPGGRGPRLRPLPAAPAAVLPGGPPPGEGRGSPQAQ